MPSSNRLYQFAVGGCLAAVLLSSAALGQQQTKENPPTVNKLKGTAVQAPTPKQSTGGDSTGRDQAPANTSPPLPAVENKGQSEETCGPRCQAAEERSKADLKAQERMAGATEEIVRISWFQFFAGLCGLAMLGLTLHHTRRTADAAIEAAKVARQEFLATHRPRLVIRQVRAVDIGPNKQPKGTITVTNTGQADATVTSIQGKISHKWNDVHNQGMHDSVINAPVIIKVGERKVFDVTPGKLLSNDEWTQIINRYNLLFLIGEIEYLDGTSVCLHTGFFWEYNPQSGRFYRPDYSDYSYED